MDLIDRTKTALAEWRIDPKHLWRQYLLTLGVLIVLVITSHLIALRTTEIAAMDAATVNQAGQQRMLSQRILYLTSRIREDRAVAHNTALLNDSLDQLEASHATLRDKARRVDALHSTYFGLVAGASLDTLVLRFLEDARLAIGTNAAESQAAYDRIRDIGPGHLLDLLQNAVSVHEAQARHHAAALTRIHKLSMIAALMLLLFEAILIFRPAHRITRQTLATLASKTGALENAQLEVNKRNRQLAALCDVAEHDAMHDSLTGLANRRHLQRELEERCHKIGDTDAGIALFQIDLDRFKDINDTLGHAAGDQILVHVAETLQKCLSDDDFIARSGGDEFVILMSGCKSRDTLDETASRIIEAIAQPIEYRGNLCAFNTSVGIEIGIEHRNGPDVDTDLMLSNADIALYRAKEKGRNNYAFFTEDMRKDVEESRALGDDLVRAIVRDEFFPVYQVQVTAGERAVHGVEALARWRHPEKGEIAPWRFLPVAERLGLTEDIDDAILRHALQDVSAWREAGLTVPNLSVNVSASRLADPDLIPRLREMGIPAGSVSFEVLESVFADRMDDTLRYTLDSLEDMGIAIEVDDFGTGHASLLALLSLRPERLKIARELIDPAPESAEHRAILESIMQIANALDTEVVGEGIETENHAEICESIGVQVLQGFHFCRPLPEPEAAARISEITQSAGKAIRAA